MRSAPPWRFAIRWTTLSVYVSSSFVPKMTSSTTPTAAATSAASNAQPKWSTLIASGLISEARMSISASSTRTARNPTSAMNGKRSAATIGGRIAFSTAISSAATTAPPKPSTETPGTIVAAISSAAALSSHDRRTRRGRYFGRSGCQLTGSPYVVPDMRRDPTSRFS